jgi:hypothetical protein
MMTEIQKADRNLSKGFQTQEEWDMKQEPIRIGDKFLMGGNQWKVIATYPGGKVEIFCEKLTRFGLVRHKDVKTWPRVAKQ